MRRSWFRAVCFALLGLMAGAAVAGVAKASAALAHACCDGAVSETAAPEAADCHGFLPLSCCDAPALPGGEPRPPDRALPILSATVALPAPLSALRARAANAPAPKPPPTRLSVVLQV